MGRILCYFKQEDAPAQEFQIKGVIHIAKPVVRAPKTRRPEYYCMRLNANAIIGTSRPSAEKGNRFFNKIDEFCIENDGFCIENDSSRRRGSTS